MNFIDECSKWRQIMWSNLHLCWSSLQLYNLLKILIKLVLK